MPRTPLSLVLLTFTACGGQDGIERFIAEPGVDATLVDTSDADGFDLPDDVVDVDPESDSGTLHDGLRVRAVTFNTGTGARPSAALAESYGWTADTADLGDTWYGNGLAWVDLIDAMAPWMHQQAPDIVAFQEIFWPGDCDTIPEEAHAGFVCAGDRSRSVAERLVGEGYTVTCHARRPDKCIAVRNEFARVPDCDGPFCLSALDNAFVDGCGSGSRVARTSLIIADGSPLTVVSVHGTSGFTADDTACRVAWFEAAFADLDPATPTIILGDFNTDPGRASESDASAARLRDLATAGAFVFATQIGPAARPTYGGILNIDHVIVRGGDGTCLAAGLDDTLPAPLAVKAFDHRPIVCDLVLR